MCRKLAFTENNWPFFFFVISAVCAYGRSTKSGFDSYEHLLINAFQAIGIQSWTKRSACSLGLSFSWGGRQTVNKADKTSKTNRALTVRRVLIRGLLAHSKPNSNPVGISSVQSLSHIWLFATQWTAAGQASLFITNSWSLLKLMSIESVMPSNHLILCRPLLPPSIFPSIRVFSS